MIPDDDPDDHELDEGFGSFDDRVIRAQKHGVRERWLIVVTLGVASAATIALNAVFQG